MPVYRERGARLDGRVDASAGAHVRILARAVCIDIDGPGPD
jgi:hypothetical protein